MEKGNSFSTFAKYAGLGFQLVVPLLLGIGIGVFIDDSFDKKPLFTMVGLFLGVAVTFYNLIRISKNSS